MPERKTVGQLMEEMRLKAGAQTTSGISSWMAVRASFSVQAVFTG